MPGEYHLTDPEAFPGRTVEESLRDYQKAVRGTKVKIVPWLRDFSLSRDYGLAEVTDQVQAARRVKPGGFMLWNPPARLYAEALSADSAAFFTLSLHPDQSRHTRAAILRA